MAKSAKALNISEAICASDSYGATIYLTSSDKEIMKKGKVNKIKFGFFFKLPTCINEGNNFFSSFITNFSFKGYVLYEIKPVVATLRMSDPTLTLIHEVMSSKVIATAWLRSFVASSNEMFWSSALLCRFSLSLFTREVG